MACPSTQIYHSRAFVIEVWVWTVVGILVFAARLAVRIHILTWRKLQGDDYMAIVTLLFFICCIFSKLAIYYYGANMDYTEEKISNLIDCQIAKVVIASKFNILSWYFYTSFLWGLKAMVLFFFSRLPLRPYQVRLHKAFAVLCGLTYVAVISTITWSCFPFHLNWATIPYPPRQCTSRTQNFYVASISNITTDVAILSVALPLLWQLRVSVQKRIELTLLLGSGIFVATAAVTAMLMSLTNSDSTLNINLWGTREEVAGIVAVNAPIIRPLFYRSFWRNEFGRGRVQLPPPRPRVFVDTQACTVDRPSMWADGRGNFLAILSRRLGILTSIQSLTSNSTTVETIQKRGLAWHVQTTAELDRVNEEHFKSLESSWGVPGEVVCRTSPSSGPRPLLPEPMPSYSTEDAEHRLDSLIPIREEEDLEVVVDDASVALSRSASGKADV